MDWLDFSIALPAQNQDILILNYYRLDNKLTKRFFVCRSEEYMKVLGENNMIHAFTFWAPIDISRIKHHEG
jgi:hypothetical protein